MRVGFIGEAVVTQRGEATYQRPPLALLDDPHAWCGSPPALMGGLYAGVVELDARQVQQLLDRTTAAGLKLALVLDVDGSEGAKPFSGAERDRLATWLTAKGLPGPRLLEGQLDFVQRIQLALNPAYPMDRTLADVERELRRMP